MQDSYKGISGPTETHDLCGIENLLLMQTKLMENQWFMWIYFEIH